VSRAAVGAHVHRGREPVGRVVVSRGVGNAGGGLLRGAAQVAQAGRVVEALPGGLEGDVAVGVVAILGLREHGVAADRKGRIPGLDGAGVALVLLDQAAGAVVVELRRQPAGRRDLDYVVAVVVPDVGAQGRPHGAVGRDRGHLGPVDPTLVV